jgi:hypothetical protein
MKLSATFDAAVQERTPKTTGGRLALGRAHKAMRWMTVTVGVMIRLLHRPVDMVKDAFLCYSAGRSVARGPFTHRPRSCSLSEEVEEVGGLEEVGIPTIHEKRYFSLG